MNDVDNNDIQIIEKLIDRMVANLAFRIRKNIEKITICAIEMIVIFSIAILSVNIQQEIILISKSNSSFYMKVFIALMIGSLCTITMLTIYIYRYK